MKAAHDSLDGTKVKANASKHKVLSYGHTSKIETQLHDEVRRLLEAAEQADAAALLIPTVVAMLEAGEAAPEQAKAAFGVAKADLHMWAAWRLSFFNKPELDAKVYAMACATRKNSRYTPPEPG